MKKLSSVTISGGLTVDQATTLSGVVSVGGIGTGAYTSVLVRNSSNQMLYRNYSDFLNDISGSLNLSGYVPTSRTLTINGTTYDLSANRTWTITTPYVSKLQHTVKAGVAINKGQAVYVTGADGTNMVVGLASNASEATSSKTMGLLDATVSTNGFANVVTEGLLAGLDTSTANAEGDPVWLGTGGNLIYGLANKPYAPAHLVFIGIVTRKNANNGEIFVKVQNGFELKEIHDVDLITSAPTAGQLLRYNSDGLWKNWSPNYLTAEADTLASVTARGASTTGEITVNGITTIQNDGYLKFIAGSVGTTGFTVFNAAQNGYLSNRITTSDHVRGWGWELTDALPTTASPNVFFRIGYNGNASFLTSGNFGIGTTNPTSPLEITNTGSAGGGYSMYNASYSAGKLWGMRKYGIDNGNGIHWSSDVQFSSTWYNAIRIGHGQNATNPSFQSYYTTYLATTGGNVGIGLITPQKKLDVYGTGIVASFGGTFSPGEFAGIHFGYSESNSNNDSYKKSALVFERTDNNNQGGNASGKIHFLLNNAISTSANSLTHSVVTIDSDANGTVGSVRMGIGTRNPARTLDVNGNIGFAGSLFGDNKKVIDVYDSWLRLNQDGQFGSGVYTPYNLRNDGAFDNYGGIYGYNTIRARKSQSASNYTTAALWTESYDNTTTGIAFHISGVVGKFLEMRTNGVLYWENSQVWTASTLTNLNQLTNGPGYITGYSETDTLQSVTSRGSTTSTLVAFSGKVTLGNRSSVAFNGNVAGLTINNTAEIRSLTAENPPALTWHYEGIATRHIVMTSAGVINVVSPSNESSGVAVLAVNGNTVWHSGNDGSGSGLDADLLDGVDSSRFIYGSGTNRRGTNNITNWNQTDYPDVAFLSAENGVANAPVSDFTYGMQYSFHRSGAAYRTQFATALYSDLGIYVRNSRDSDVWTTWKRLWHSDDFTSTNVSNWNTAYGWGNHASQSYATTSYVTTQINNLIAGAPGALDTLDELAAALGDDSNFATTVTNSIAGKVSKAGDTMTGNLTLAGGTNILFTGGSHAIAGNNTGYLHFYDYTNVYFNNQLVIRGGIQNDGGNVLIDDNLNVNGELAFLSGGGGYTNIIRSAAYPSEGYPPGSNYWIEYRAQGGHHFILNTDGGVGSGANSMDDFVVWQGAIDGNRLLEVSNIGNLWIAGSLTEASSLKLKENVETSEGNLEKVVNLRPVTYNKIGSQTTELGLIAEEVAEVYPEFVQYDENGEPIGVNYSRLTAALIGAVKELTNQVQELNKKING